MPKRYNSMHILYFIHVFLVIMIKNKFLFDHIRFSHCLQFDLTVIERIQRYSSILASKVSLSELIFIIWKSYTCVVIQMKPYFYVACVQEGTSVHRLIFILQDTGFVRVLEILESPGILLSHFPGLESPGNLLNWIK